VVLAGGVFAHHPGFAASVRALARDVPATAFTTVSDGAVGVAVLTLRELGVTVDAPTHHRVASTLRDLVRRPWASIVVERGDGSGVPRASRPSGDVTAGD